MKLYEISEQYQNALIELEDSGLPEEVISDTLEALAGDLEVKAKNVAAFIKNREAEIEAVKAASKKLQDRAKAEQARLDKMIDYLKYNMEASGITEIRSPELILKIKKNPPSVVIDNQEALSKEYMVEKITYAPDKKAIKKAIEDGLDISGARIVHGTRLSIE